MAWTAELRQGAQLAEHSWRITMPLHRYTWVIPTALGCVAIMAFMLTHTSAVQAQGQYPILTDIANKVIQKYQNSSCEQLWEQRSAHTPPSAEEQRAIGVLRSDPQMRAAFINLVAPPIANKMFDCGMIP
jgi:hypothetical protein